MMNMHLTDVLYLEELQEISQLDLGVREPYFTSQVVVYKLMDQGIFDPRDLTQVCSLVFFISI